MGRRRANVTVKTQSAQREEIPTMFRMSRSLEGSEAGSRNRTRTRSRRVGLGVEGLESRQVLSGLTIASQGHFAPVANHAPAYVAPISISAPASAPAKGTIPGIVSHTNSTIAALNVSPALSSQRIAQLRAEGILMAKAVDFVTGWHFSMYLLEQSLQSNPPNLVIGTNHQSFLNQITSAPEFTQAAKAAAQAAPVGKAVSGVSSISLESTRDLFLSLDQVEFNYTVQRTDASHYTMNVVVSDRYTFPLNAAYKLTPTMILGWSANDIAWVFEQEGVIQPYNIQTAVIHLSGNLSTGSVNVTSVG
jgi:hypothetical protein